MKSYLLKDLSDELLRAVKVRAAQESVTMKELIIRFIEEGLKRGEERHGKG